MEYAAPSSSGLFTARGFPPKCHSSLQSSHGRCKMQLFPACLSELDFSWSWSECLHDFKSLPFLADLKILFIWKYVYLCYKQTGVKQRFSAIKKMTYLCRYLLVFCILKFPGRAIWNRKKQYIHNTAVTKFIYVSFAPIWALCQLVVPLREGNHRQTLRTTWNN